MKRSIECIEQKLLPSEQIIRPYSAVVSLEDAFDGPQRRTTCGEWLWEEIRPLNVDWEIF